MFEPLRTKTCGISAVAASLLFAAIACSATAGAPADNSYCLVCHANFKTEKLSFNHQKHGVGCEKCHGPSDRHSADEDGLTPPEIMFAKENIKSACTKCHSENKLRTVDEHSEAFAKDPAKVKTCTACHGEHRMAARTRVWDKTTGKLIKAEGVRMMQKNSAAGSAR